MHAARRFAKPDFPNPGFEPAWPAERPAEPLSSDHSIAAADRTSCAGKTLRLDHRRHAA